MKRAPEEHEPAAAAAANGADGASCTPKGPAPPKKRRKGRRKSKAERLARRVPGATHSSVDSLPTLADLRALLTDERSSTSHEWDAAQSLALRLGSTEARVLLVRTLLVDKRAPRAAAHYAKRLALPSDELLDGVLGLNSSTLDALTTAQFLVEIDEETVPTHERLQRFLWPWLTQLQRESTKMPADPGTLAATRERKAAVHLLLHAPPATHTDAKAVHKRERSLALQRALVAQCLRLGTLLHLVPAHARAFEPLLSLSTPDDSTCEASRNDSDMKIESIQTRCEVATRVQRVLQLLWPDARVLVFGSSATQLALSDADGDAASTADVDLCVLLPSCEQFRQDTAALVTEAAEHLTLYLVPCDETATAVTGARVPIVRWQDPVTHLPCDLCVNNVAAVWNSRLLRWLLHAASPMNVRGASAMARQRQEVRRLCAWLRRWRQAKPRAVRGALSAYGLTLLALFYLQRAGVLPVADCSDCVKEDKHALSSLTDEVADAKLEALEKQLVSVEAQPAVRGWRALRRGFFRFYACEFDYEHAVVSLRSSNAVLKSSKGWQRSQGGVAAQTHLSLEDPVETTRDLGALCSRRAMGRLRCAFAHACVVLSEAEEAQETELLATWAYEVDSSRDEAPEHETETDGALD